MKKILLLILIVAAGYSLYRYMDWNVDVSVQPVETAESLAPQSGSAALAPAPEQAAQLAGVYLANREGVTDILELHPDGSYARNYRSPAGAFIHQGSWEQVGDHVNFTNFAVAPEEETDEIDTWKTSRQDWSARLLMGRNDVQIVINAEHALLYTKRG